MLIRQLIYLSVCLSSCPSPFIRRNLQPTKQEFLFYIFLFLWNTTLEKKKHKQEKYYNRKWKYKKKKNNLVVPHTTQNSKELRRSHILQAHVKVQRCIYRFKKKWYVKIICACVHASVEVTKWLFPQAFVLDLIWLWGVRYHQLTGSSPT